MTQQRCWFPVLGIDREDVEYALGFDPGLTDERMEILVAALHDVLRKKGFEQLLEDTLNELKKTLEIVAPRVEVQSKCLDASPAAEQLLRDFKECLRQVRDGITDLDGASFACFPFGFSRKNPKCQGYVLHPNSPVCELCRELHGFDPEHKEYKNE